MAGVAVRLKQDLAFLGLQLVLGDSRVTFRGEYYIKMQEKKPIFTPWMGLINIWAQNCEKAVVATI